MQTLDDTTIAWLRGHHGIITTERLISFGVTRWTRQKYLDSGLLVPVHKGVYRVATQPVTLEARCTALSAFQPRGYITGPSAGRLLGLRRMPANTGRATSMLALCVPHGEQRRIDGVRTRQSRLIEPTDIQRRADGINIASPWRLAFDLAADLTPLDLQSVIEQILDKGLCRLPTLAHTARRLARPARPGSLAFVTALTHRLPGGSSESHPELVVGKALQARGIPIVVQSTWLDLPDRTRARLDMSVPEIRWGLEVDVHPDHFLQQGTTDRRRDRLCHMIGWQVDRVTATDLLDMSHLVPELVMVYRARLREMNDR